MICIIDNYDSFTYNLVHLFGAIDPDVVVHRNDAVTAADVLAAKPDYVVFSPGPGIPEKAGNLVDIARVCGPSIPTIGVCLGHQALAVAHGGSVSHAPTLMHGKASPVYHTGDALFKGLPQPFEAGRYHSLTVNSADLPDGFEAIAHSSDGELMAMKHTSHPMVGIQFHPESVLTPLGIHMMRNFTRTYRPAPAG